MPPRLVRVLAFLLLLAPAGVSAQPFAYYNLDALGVPKFVNTVYIDLATIRQISKFRSAAGHDYHDDLERCRSMKHYFIRPGTSAAVSAPVAGTVSRLRADTDGTQVHITSDLQPAFVFILFHVALAKPLTIGERVADGQRLGNHASAATYSDIAVGVNTPTGYRLVSYFDTLTDDAFAPFTARGVASRSQLIYTRAQRDADPYRCVEHGSFTNLRTSPDLDYVTLTGDPATTTPQAGWWWNPAEPGRGFAIDYSPANKMIFLGAFLYDSSGTPVWYSAALAEHGPDLYYGYLVRYQGGQAAATSTVAWVQLTLTSTASALLSISGAGLDPTSIAIERFAFASGGTGLASRPTQPGTGWWWNSAAGWRGCFIEVQGSSMFLVNFTYDADGRPVWSASQSRLLDDTAFQGTLTWHTGGQTLGGRYTPPGMAGPIGTVSVGFTSPVTGTLALPDGTTMAIRKIDY